MNWLFNNGQFGEWLNNIQMNAYNRQLSDWQQQQAQYEQDMDYWDQMNRYDQNASYFRDISTGRMQGPTQPRQKPGVIGQRPTAPSQFDWSGFGNMGGGGGWGGQFQPTGAPGGGGGFSYGPWEGSNYVPPEGWDERSIDTAGMVDPSAVIASAQPGIMEQMNNAFADAGVRFGSSGMVGTPYASALGDASRNAANDIANITNQYQFQAATDAAQREQQRQLAEYEGNLRGWAQAGDWQHQGQMADQDRDFGAWSQQGDWQYGANQAGQDRNMQRWMAENNWRLQDYMQQQQFGYDQQQQMMQFLPMLMQMMGGGGY